MLTLTLDKKAFDKAVEKLERLPKRIQGNALRSATNAGARVIANDIKSLAPGCLKGSVKTVRGRIRDGVTKVSIKSGYGHSRENAIDRLDKAVTHIGADAGVKSAQKKLQVLNCPPAFWVEFGTYRNRNLVKHPYSPQTLKRHPDYRKYGHTMAPRGTGFFWSASPAQREKTGITYIPARPFMRPGMMRALRSGRVDMAIAAKLNEYFKKAGV